MPAISWLPHEIGHYAHYLEALETGEDHWARPTQQLEDFAHRDADEFRAAEQAAGRLPFDRLWPAARLVSSGLKKSWFESSP